MTEEEYVVFIQPYEDALKNIRVRVEVLNDDYRRKYQNYPIHHVQDRIKKKESIEQKLIRRGYESDVESARDCLTDISGIRVICYFVLEVLLKGLEKGPDRVSVIIPRKLQRNVIYSGRRCPNCKNGNTAHEPQNVQYDQISKLPDKTPDRIIIIKKTRQHKSYPFSFL